MRRPHWGHHCSSSGHLIFIALISQLVNDIFKSSVRSRIVSTIYFFFFALKVKLCYFSRLQLLFSCTLKCVTVQYESLCPMVVKLTLWTTWRAVWSPLVSVEGPAPAGAVPRQPSCRSMHGKSGVEGFGGLVLLVYPRLIHQMRPLWGLACFS